MMWLQGRYEQAVGVLRGAQAIAERLHDDERLAHIHFTSGWFMYDQLELDRPFEHQQACLHLCERRDCLQSMRRVYWGLGQSCRALSEDINDRRAKAIEYHLIALHLSGPPSRLNFLMSIMPTSSGRFICFNWATRRRQCGISSAPMQWRAGCPSHCTWPL
jgi:hypothetical protein